MYYNEASLLSPYFGLIMKPHISPSELLALTAISGELSAAKKPSLGSRYRLIGGVGAAFGIVIATIAVCNPVFFITELISPSIIPLDQLIDNTRIRGIFTILLILLWLLSHHNTKHSLALVIGLLLWSTAVTAIDLYKLLDLQVFTATITSAAYLMTRPIIFVALMIMTKDLVAHLEAMNVYNQSKSPSNSQETKVSSSLQR
jgi:hypothetical protein